MNMQTEEHLSKNKKAKLHILCGFDGFVDTIVRPVKTETPGENIYFDTIREFGEYLIQKAEKSCSLKLDTMQRRMGGNAPIFAKAVAQMGEKVTCIGAMGENGCGGVFEELKELGTFLSVAEPGQSTAMEFRDGKILLAQNSDLNELDYDWVAERVGEENLMALIRQADVFALLNWSELQNATKLWEGLFHHCFSRIAPAEGKRVIVDLCDCSAKTEEQLEELFALLRRFSQHAQVLLTLNENEADVLGRHFKIEAKTSEELAKALHRKVQVQNLVIHAIGYACGVSGQNCEYVPVTPVKRPVISTGAGDHFNGGLAVGWGRGMNLRQALELANAVTCFYVSTGRGPASENLRRMLEEKYSTFVH